MPNLNMPVKYCTDENNNKFSPVVYQESMFDDDGNRMDPVPRKMIAKAYDPTKTYPTENLFCIQDNKYYKFTGSGTTTGTFDPTKWTETDDATELTTLNSTLTDYIKIVTGNVALSTGFSSYIAFPTGYNANNCCVLNFEVFYSNLWRCGDGIAGASNNRLFTALDSYGIRIYNDNSSLYGVNARVVLHKYS